MNPIELKLFVTNWDLYKQNINSMLKIKSKHITLQSIMDTWYKGIMVCLTRTMDLMFLNIKKLLTEGRAKNSYSQVL